MKVARVAEMRAMDRRAIESCGVPEELLMENAGLAACEVVGRELGGAVRSFAVFAGPGNNGGDGLVVARQLHSRGARVSVVLVGDRAKMRGAAALNLDIVSRLGIPLLEFGDGAGARRHVQESGAIVDGLLGTGLSRAPEGPMAWAIALINGSGKPVVALDIPSGVAGDTAQAPGPAVRARATVAFGLPKPGLLIHPGAELAGRVYVSHISFPPYLYDDPALALALFDFPVIPARRADGHKGIFGKALFVAGSTAYRGAPVLAALAFLRAGGGLSFLATPAAILPPAGSPGLEVVLLPQETDASGAMGPGSAGAILQAASGADVVVLGPGISLAPGAQDLARRLVRDVDRPLLVDGDGLTALAADPPVLAGRTAPTVLTPHAAELARLLGLPVGQVLADRTTVLREAAMRLRATVLLKGPGTIVAHPDGRVYFNLSGNDGLATAGTGDVLAGTVAAAFCLGLPFEEAARAGVYLHGLAGDLAAEAKGRDGLIASDLLESLPAALLRYRTDLPELRRTLGGRITRL